MTLPQTFCIKVQTSDMEIKNKKKLVEAIHFVFILTSWYFLSACNILPGIAVIHHLLYCFTLLEKWALSAARLSMLCSQCCLLSTCFHHALRDKLRVHESQDTLHIWDSLLLAHHTAQPSSREQRGLEAGVGYGTLIWSYILSPSEGEGLKEWHDSNMRLGQATDAGSSCDSLNFAQLCAVSPSVLPLFLFTPSYCCE